MNKSRFAVKTGTIALFAIFLPSFISGHNIPDGQVWAKELCFLFITVIVIGLLTPYYFLSVKSIRVHLIDILVVVYLLYRMAHNMALCPLNGIPSFFYVNGGLLIIYIAIRLSADKTMGFIRITSIAIVLTLSIQVLIGILQELRLVASFNPYFNITGAFFNPGPYSIWVVCLLCYTVVLSYEYYHRTGIDFKIILLGILQIMALYLIVKCLSRSSWLAGIFSITLFSVVKFPFFYKKHLRLAIIFILISISFISIYFYNLKPISAQGRVLIWEVSLNLIKKNVLWGVGEGNFAYNYINYQGTYFSESPVNNESFGAIASDVRHAFNELLQVCAETGVIGLILYIIIVCLVFAQLLTNVRNNSGSTSYLSLGFIMLFSALFISSLFSYVLSLIPFKALNFAVFALSVNCSGSTSVKKVFNLPLLIRKFLAFLAVFLTATLGCYTLSTSMAINKWMDLVIYSPRVQLQKATEMSSILDKNGYYLYYIGDLYLQTRQYNKAIAHLERAKLLLPDKIVYLGLADAYCASNKIVFAEKQYRSLSDAYPKNIELKWYLAHFYAKTGQKSHLKNIQQLVKNFPDQHMKRYEIMKSDILSLNIK